MKERFPNIPEYTNQFCSFRPAGWSEIDKLTLPVLFKVVTEDLKSLGLRNNTNILTYPVGVWIRLQDSEIIPGSDDRGGIWSALTISGARSLSKYMFRQYGTSVRIFETAIENPLYANSYRVKAQGVILLREIQLDQKT